MLAQANDFPPLQRGGWGGGQGTTPALAVDGQGGWSRHNTRLGHPPEKGGHWRRRLRVRNPIENRASEAISGPILSMAISIGTSGWARGMRKRRLACCPTSR